MKTELRENAITLSEVCVGKFVIEDENGRGIVIDMPEDYARLAVAFGWNLHRRPLLTSFEYLVSNVGETVADPGYFDDEIYFGDGLLYDSLYWDHLESMQENNQVDMSSLVAFPVSAIPLCEWVVCPEYWVNEDIAFFRLSEANLDGHITAQFHPGCVNLSDLEDVFFSSNVLFTLLDEGFLNKNCVEAFKGGE